ncbi:MAG: c-type cytochrome domain-containing protein [Verrucomicrobiales bacterium]
MRRFFILLGFSCLFVSLAHAEADLDPDQLAVLRVQPLLRGRCMACHGDDANKIKGGYDMREREGLYGGGDSGSIAIVPQKPEESPLYLSVNRAHEDWEAMPPKASDSLDKREIAWLRDWIAGGHRGRMRRSA